MVVLILEKVPISLKGEITKWMIELKSGVFIGSISALVRDKLWMKACRQSDGGGCIMAYNSNNEQDFQIRFWGNCSRELIDFDGLVLTKIPCGES